MNMMILRIVQHQQIPSMLEYQKLLSDTDDSDSIISSIINDSSTISTTTIDREPILKKLSFSGKKASGLRGPSKSIPKKPSCIKQEQYKYRDGIPTQLTIKTASKEKKANNCNGKRKGMSSMEQTLKKSFTTPAKTPKTSNAGPTDGEDSLVFSYSKYNVEADGTINKTNYKPPHEVKFDNAKSKKLNRELAKLQMGVAYKYKTCRKKPKKN